MTIEVQQSALTAEVERLSSLETLEKIK